MTAKENQERMRACYNGELITDEAAAALQQQPYFLSAHSLLETIRWQNGRMCLPGYHWQRLLSGMEALSISRPEAFNFEWLRFQLEQAALANDKNATARLRLQVAQAADASLHVLITCAALPAPGTTVHAGIARNVYKQRDFLSHLKTNDRQIYNLAARVAAENGWDEALLCNDVGRIIESTIANIFWIEGERIFTPPLSEGCVAGVMRAYLLERLPEWGFKVAEALLPVERLAAADEVFLTNALRGVRLVKSIGEVYTYRTSHGSRLLQLSEHQ